MGLSSGTFWAMSLPEWRAAVAGYATRTGARRAAPLARADLEQLMRKFPDR